MCEPRLYMRFVFFSVLWTCAFLQIDPGNQFVTCEQMVNISFCDGIGYRNASFPNFRSQTRQADANRELLQFTVLVNTGCSNAIVHYLCSVYAPVCLGYMRLPPCANLCTYVRDACAPVLLMYGISWPPPLACEQWPTYGTVCYGPPTDQLSVLTIPNNTLFSLPSSTSSFSHPATSSFSLPSATSWFSQPATSSFSQPATSSFSLPSATSSFGLPSATSSFILPSASSAFNATGIVLSQSEYTFNSSVCHVLILVRRINGINIPFNTSGHATKLN